MATEMRSSPPVRNCHASTLRRQRRRPAKPFTSVTLIAAMYNLEPRNNPLRGPRQRDRADRTQRPGRIADTVDWPSTPRRRSASLELIVGFDGECLRAEADTVRRPEREPDPSARAGPPRTVYSSASLACLLPRAAVREDHDMCRRFAEFADVRLPSPQERCS